MQQQQEEEEEKEGSDDSDSDLDNDSDIQIIEDSSDSDIQVIENHTPSTSVKGQSREDDSRVFAVKIISFSVVRLVVRNRPGRPTLIKWYKGCPGRRRKVQRKRLVRKTFFDRMVRKTQDL